MVRTIRRSYFGLFAVIAAMVLLCVLATSSTAAAGDTTRVSVASDGTEANHHAGGTFISADGRYVVFSSRASNLVPGDTNHDPNGDPVQDIFVRDRDADNDGVMDETDQPEATKMERVSVDSSGNESNGFSSVGSMSADGRFVAFTSWANNLVPGDTNGDPNGGPASDIYVHDRQAGTTELVSVGSGNWPEYGSSISADGRCVAFFSGSTTLVAGDTN